MIDYIYYYIFLLMAHIITTTHLQKHIGELSETIEERSFIITNRGIGKMVLLPYFDGCDENITDYLEDFEMAKNKMTLKKRYEASARSGKSSISV